LQAEPPPPCCGQDLPPATAAAAAAAGAEAGGQAQSTAQQLPSHLSDDQYSTAAFKSLLSTAAAGGQSLTDVVDQSCLSDAVTDESTPLQDRVLLLQQGLVHPAVLPVQLLVALVQEWVGTESWNNTPATDWVTNNWSSFTAEQVRHHTTTSISIFVLCKECCNSVDDYCCHPMHFSFYFCIRVPACTCLVTYAGGCHRYI
jgi:hypothetical protein